MIRNSPKVFNQSWPEPKSQVELNKEILFRLSMIENRLKLLSSRVSEIERELDRGNWC